MRQSSRAIAFPESDHRAADGGVIAIDGNQSRDVDQIDDRFCLPSGVDGGHRFGDQGQPRDDALLTADEQADALGRGRNQFCRHRRTGRVRR